MPKFFNYEVSTIESGYTRYYAHFKVLNPLPGSVVYDWDFEDTSPNQAGINIVKEYAPGEYLISLYKIVGNAPSELVESATVFIIAIPQSKLANGQLQPINTVDLFPTVGLKQSVMLPTKMLELGDSYAQNKSDYINEFDETWDIATGLLTELQKDRLEATLEQLGGVSPFNFIPSIGETAVSIICESWRPTQLSNSDYQLSIQAKRFWSRPKVGLSIINYEVITEITTTYIRNAAPREVLVIQRIRFKKILPSSPSSIYIDPTGFRVVSDGYGTTGFENVFLLANGIIYKAGANSTLNGDSPDAIGSETLFSSVPTTVGIRTEARTDTAIILSITPKFEIS